MLKSRQLLTIIPILLRRCYRMCYISFFSRLIRRESPVRMYSVNPLRFTRKKDQFRRNKFVDCVKFGLKLDLSGFFLLPN